MGSEKGSVRSWRLLRVLMFLGSAVCWLLLLQQTLRRPYSWNSDGISYAYLATHKVDGLVSSKDHAAHIAYFRSQAPTERARETLGEGPPSEWIPAWAVARLHAYATDSATFSEYLGFYKGRIGYTSLIRAVNALTGDTWTSIRFISVGAVVCISMLVIGWLVRKGDPFLALFVSAYLFFAGSMSEISSHGTPDALLMLFQLMLAFALLGKRSDWEIAIVASLVVLSRQDALLGVLPMVGLLWDQTLRKKIVLCVFLAAFSWVILKVTGHTSFGATYSYTFYVDDRPSSNIDFLKAVSIHFAMLKKAVLQLGGSAPLAVATVGILVPRLIANQSAPWLRVFYAVTLGTVIRLFVFPNPDSRFYVLWTLVAVMAIGDELSNGVRTAKVEKALLQ